MKKFLKRLLKGIGYSVIVIAIATLVTIFLDFVLSVSSVLYWILIIGLLLFCGYQMAK